MEHTITTGFVEPDCRPVGLEVSVALAARGATGILKPRSFDWAAESARRRLVRSEGFMVAQVGQWQRRWIVSSHGNFLVLARSLSLSLSLSLYVDYNDKKAWDLGVQPMMFLFVQT